MRGDGKAAALLPQSKALLAPELSVEAVEGELSRHGRLPARTQSGELAGHLALGTRAGLRRRLNLKPDSLVIGKPSVFRFSHYLRICNIHILPRPSVRILTFLFPSPWPLFPFRPLLYLPRSYPRGLRSHDPRNIPGNDEGYLFGYVHRYFVRHLPSND